MRRFTSRKHPGRDNDNPAMFRKRYAKFRRLNPEILNHYKDQRLLIEVNSNLKHDIRHQFTITKQIDTSNTIEIAFGNLTDALENKIKKYEKLNMPMLTVPAAVELARVKAAMETFRTMKEYLETQLSKETEIRMAHLRQEVKRQERILELMSTLRELVRKLREESGNGDN